MWIVRWVRLRGPFGDGDAEPESLDPALEPLRLNSGIMTALEVACTGVVVEGAGGEQVPGALQDGVGDGDSGLVGATWAGDPRVEAE